jgi:hypothetical protein
MDTTTTTNSHDLDVDRSAIADAHARWVFGWERNPGDAPFRFGEILGDLSDMDGTGRFYDDFDAEHRIATTPREYGAIGEPNFLEEAGK